MYTNSFKRLSKQCYLKKNIKTILLIFTCYPWTDINFFSLISMTHFFRKKRSSFKIGYRNDPPRVYILQKRKRKNSKRQTISLKYTFNIANIDFHNPLTFHIFMKTCRWRSWILFIPVRLLCLPLIHISSISLVTSVRLDPWYFT